MSVPTSGLSAELRACPKGPSAAPVATSVHLFHVLLSGRECSTGSSTQEHHAGLGRDAITLLNLIPTVRARGVGGTLSTTQRSFSTFLPEAHTSHGTRWSCLFLNFTYMESHA